MPGDAVYSRRESEESANDQYLAEIEACWMGNTHAALFGLATQRGGGVCHRLRWSRGVRNRCLTQLGEGSRTGAFRGQRAATLCARDERCDVADRGGGGRGGRGGRSRRYCPGGRPPRRRRRRFQCGR